MQQLPLGVRIPDRAVFESFLPARNLQAVEHALRVANGAVTGAAWICGPAASGKTHLLQAVCARASENGGRAGYFPLVELAALGTGVLEGLTLSASWNGSGRFSRCCGKSRRKRDDWSSLRRRLPPSCRGGCRTWAPASLRRRSFSCASWMSGSNRKLCNCGPGCGDSSFLMTRRVGSSGASPGTCERCTSSWIRWMRQLSLLSAASPFRSSGLCSKSDGSRRA